MSTDITEIEASEAESSHYYIKEHQGEIYRRLLQKLHRDFKPKNYLEVGILRGATLALARVPAIGVDPSTALPAGFVDEHPNVRVFQLTSDAFFEKYDPKELFGEPIDFAFLDGLHLAEALLKDFINTEKSCARESVIVLHDCIPTDIGMTRRSQRPGPDDRCRNPAQWAGDVWRIIPVLKRYRPDLRIGFFDAPPTGVVLVTDLDPGNTTLNDNFDAIVTEMLATRLEDVGLQNYVNGLGVRPTTSVTTRADI